MAYGRNRRRLVTGFTPVRSKKVGVNHNDQISFTPPSDASPISMRAPQRKGGTKKTGRKKLPVHTAKTKKITIAVSQAEREEWISRARKENLSLSAWVRQQIHS